MSIAARIDQLLHKHNRMFFNVARRRIIEEVVSNHEALVSDSGVLATWGNRDSAGLHPETVVIVRRPENESLIYWDSPNNRSITAETFDMLVDDTLDIFSRREKLYVVDRVVGADSAWTLPLRVISDSALTALVTDNLFRLAPSDLKRSVFYRQTFTILAASIDRLDLNRYQNHLPASPHSGKPSTTVLAIDFERQLGILFGSTSSGSIKHMVFSVMSYLLPTLGILPLNAAASAGHEGNISLLVGPTGTGKSVLSVDAPGSLLGDDQHAWSANGVAGFEAGCYPLLAGLDPQTSPEIYPSLFRSVDFHEHGGLIENALCYPNGTIDLQDMRLTANSRGLFPVNLLTNRREPPLGPNPTTMLLLTNDAQGVLPPVARLNHEQAVLWFLMGYSSVVTGSEGNDQQARSTFAEPYFIRHPKEYITLFVDRLQQAATDVYLVNTGWTGGPCGVGNRINMQLTRAMVQAAIKGALKDIPCDHDPIFRLRIPQTCPGVPEPVLASPKNTWSNKAAYDTCALKLAREFSAHFDRMYEYKDLPSAVRAQCPGL
jgi:phosphoenolpyruvate carboxykinase (ATP)